MRYVSLGLYALAVVSVFVVPIEHLRDYGTLWAGVAVLVSWYFVIGNLLKSRWYKSEEGVHLMVFSSAVAVVMTLVLGTRLFGPGPAAVDVAQMRTAVIVYITFAFLMAWRAVMFTRRQIASRRRKAQA